MANSGVFKVLRTCILFLAFFLIVHRGSVTLLAARQEDQFQILQTSMTAKLTEAIRDQISALIRWPRFIEDQQQKLRSEVISISSSRSKQSKYSQQKRSALRTPESTDPQQTSSPSFSVDGYTQQHVARLAELEEGLCESLSFPVMWDREDQIADAELKTFDWILQNPKSQEFSWSDFMEWLENGKGLYWISGKAGSGKSTLMKYLHHHPKVSDTLQVWSGEIPLITANFFFWYDGNELQKTQVGLFRSLLHQALKDHCELIPIVLSDEAGR